MSTFKPKLFSGAAICLFCIEYML